jgi:AcrR family transcriptional regulator
MLDEPRPTVPQVTTPAQRRVVDAALSLFGRCGVGGTSLQMIADEIGVTKAAVYHQYQAKEEIVRVAAADELARLEQVVRTAETESTASRAREAVLAGIVDLAIERRGTVGTFLNDPAVVDLFVDYPPFHDVMRRLFRLLVKESSPEADLQATMLIAAISGALIHPLSVGLDDEVLRAQMLRLARRFLGLRA